MAVGKKKFFADIYNMEAMGFQGGILWFYITAFLS